MIFNISKTIFIFLFYHLIVDVSFGAPIDHKIKNFPSSTYKAFFLHTNKPEINSWPNWSGAHWNYKNKTLWICRNKWGVKAYQFNESQKNFFEIKSFQFLPEKKYDFEAITQEDEDKNIFLLINERMKLIQEFDFSGDKPKELARWDLTTISQNNNTYEGMVFVPNELLAAQSFTANNGSLYLKSKFNRRGIILISDQTNGGIIALDLGPNGTFKIIGQYKLPITSTRGLELDKISNTLYAIDGKNMAQFKLSSKPINTSPNQGIRAFDIISLFKGPGPIAAEGLAMAPQLLSPSTTSVFITDDDNIDLKAAIRWFEIPKQN